jgi:hypothetical protein
MRQPPRLPEFVAAVGFVGSVASVVSLCLERWGLGAGLFVAAATWGALWWWLTRREAAALLSAVDALHSFIHGARDGTAELVEGLATPAPGGGPMPDPEFELRMLDFMRDRLAALRLVFLPLVGRGTKVWTAMRELRPDPDHPDVQYYVTACRAGDCDNTARDRHSRPARSDSGLARYLREEYRRGRGVVTLNASDKAPAVWDVNGEADALGDDAGMMCAPVIVRGADHRPYMAMIVYVNSPRDQAFCEPHAKFLRCATDVLSACYSRVYSVARTGQAARS